LLLLLVLASVLASGFLLHFSLLASELCSRMYSVSYLLSVPTRGHGVEQFIPPLSGKRSIRCCENKCLPSLSWKWHLSCARIRLSTLLRSHLFRRCYLCNVCLCMRSIGNVFYSRCLAMDAYSDILAFRQHATVCILLLHFSTPSTALCSIIIGAVIDVIR
jgi:hypothetical protein